MHLFSRARRGSPGLLFLFVCGDAGSQIRIPLTLTDPAPLRGACGFDGLATRCIDPGLGVRAPGGCSNPFVCASFRDVRPDASACLGEGLLLDLRPFGPACDTFRLAVASPASPLVLRWAIPDDAGFDSLHLVDLFGGTAVRIDMLAEDSAALDPTVTPELYVAAWAPCRSPGRRPGAGRSAPGLLASHPVPSTATTITSAGPRERVRLAVYDLLGRRGGAADSVRMRATMPPSGTQAIARAASTCAAWRPATPGP
jgi:hypothetical protein